jgi:hypothetical protein
MFEKRENFSADLPIENSKIFTCDKIFYPRQDFFYQRQDFYLRQDFFYLRQDFLPATRLATNSSAVASEVEIWLDFSGLSSTHSTSGVDIIKTLGPKFTVKTYFVLV